MTHETKVGKSALKMVLENNRKGSSNLSKKKGRANPGVGLQLMQVNYRKKGRAAKDKLYSCGGKLMVINHKKLYLRKWITYPAISLSATIQE